MPSPPLPAPPPSPGRAGPAEERPDSGGGIAPGALLDGRFRIQRLLGRGGMGAVYQAHDEQSGREVAIKTVTGALSAARLERFEREGRITASLRHAGIVALHSAGQADGRPYLVYELVEGARELGQVLPELERSQRVVLLRDAATALGHAHAQGVIHRDVKLENLLVDADGHLRVADFGLANAAGDERLTQTGALLGTPHYMAPEQLNGDTGPYTDVWALGVSLYRALTDAMPFEGSTLAEIVDAVQAGAPSPRKLDPTISPELERVVLRALATPTRARYPDAAALAADLDACLSGGRIARRSRGAAGFVGALALALVIGGAWALAHQATPAPPTPAASPTRPAVTPRALSPAQLAEGESALQRLELSSEVPELERLARAQDWLERWGTHPAAARARRLHDALRQAVPWRFAGLVPANGSKRSGLSLFSQGSWFCFVGKAVVELELLESGRGLREVRRFRLPVGADRVLWAPDGGILVSAQHSVYYVRADGTESYLLLSVPGQGASDLMAVWERPQGLSLVIAHGQQALAYPLTLGARPAVGEPQVVGDYAGIVYALASSPDHRQLAISAHERPELIDLLGTTTRRWPGTSSQSPCDAFAFSPDGQSLATGHDNGIVLLLGLHSQEQRPIREVEHAGSNFQGAPVAHVGGIRRLLFAADGRLLITAARLASLERRSALKLWEVETGELLRTIPLAGDIESVELHPTRLRVAVGFKLGRFEVWELE